MAGESDSSVNDSGLMASINVTPFVDVVLVLLTIFMVTAPLIAKDILKLHLPKAASNDGKAMSTIGVGVNRDGQIILNGSISSEPLLQTEVARALKENPETQAIISADVETQYGNVVRVIDIIKSAGLSRFAIQIERK